MARLSQGSTRDLWQFLTGATRPQELIAMQLHQYKFLLTTGLSYYKQPSNPSGELLEKELKHQIRAEQKEAVKKLSQFLGLDEIITYDIYRLYLQHDYRGSQKDLQTMLGEDRHMRALVLRTRDFYFSERLYLLRCIKHILSKWQHEGYRYQEVFFDFLEDVNKDNALIENVLDQYEMVCSTTAPSLDTYGNYMTEEQAVLWLKQNLREQIELLQIMMYYYKDFQHPLPKLGKVLKQFKDQGFGRHQLNKHLLDETTELAVECIGGLQVLLILEGLDLEFFYVCMEDNDFSRHHVLSESRVTQEFETHVKTLGESVHHGPILLAWSVISHLSVGYESESLSKRLGNHALQLDVFRYLSAALGMEVFDDKALSEMSHSIVYGLLTIVLKTFEKDTLGDTEALYDIVAKVLSQTCVAEDFWDKGLQEGIGPLFQAVCCYFPLQFRPLLQLATALASANSDSAAKVSRHLQHLQYYTEWLDRYASDELEATNDLVWQLRKQKMPYGTVPLCYLMFCA
ncbi:nucleoporin NUP188 homolog [Lingula anatina]|uniref:Nucleoporin NUP188 homolog n=1 Tax=Lingula anatina TaxID=7574 RepID=A0A1S3I198_LINAN|nr:nucleoporin NUP188 homolog [Lingula anatina]|eukprot:XP_013391601.1 nucleoporin NUP188 homolog [Lingula anatina]